MRSPNLRTRKISRDLMQLALLLLSVLPAIACEEGAGNGRTFACTEQGVRDAIAEGGGVHTFDCDGDTIIRTLDPIVIEQDVILDGEGDLALDGNQRHAVLAVAQGVIAELRGFSIQNGRVTASSAIGESGGGIFNRGELTLLDCFVAGNQAEEAGGGVINYGTLNLIDTELMFNSARVGAGVANVGGALFADGVDFVGNQAEDEGGALHLAGGGPGMTRAEADIRDTLFSSNNAPFGAAMWLAQADASLRSTLVDGNFAYSDSWAQGGGAYVSNDSTLDVWESTFSDNGAESQGGAIYMQDSDVYIWRSTISGNTAGWQGGGINSNGGGGTLRVMNSTFWKNEADLHGGAILIEQPAFISHTTFKGNTAEEGGAIYTIGDVRLFNSYLAGSCRRIGGSWTSKHSYSLNAAGCPGLTPTLDLAAYGNLSDNGGPTQTVPLLSGVTIDVIPLEDCGEVPGVAPPSFHDQRGVERVVDSGTRCDVGAFEVVR